MPCVLILGGTGEAADLAGRLVRAFGDRLDVVTSLAGRTATPRPLPGTVRTGGFGGAAGLAEYLESERIDALVDATHPFAGEMSANAVAAAEAVRVPRLVLTRRPWTPVLGDRWIEVGDLRAAADAVCDRPELGHIFLAVGSGGLVPFRDVASRVGLVRVAETPAAPLPFAGGAIVVDRGPFTEAADVALLKAHRIGAVVSRNAGGPATYGKIAAARTLGIPVVMVRRPAAAEDGAIHSVDDAVRWVAGTVGLDVSAAP
jgi:precorrin-6A/cobalt-precorrin-6A reductase